MTDVLGSIQEQGMEILNNKGFNVDNIYRVVVLAMETIDGIPDFSGAQKKELVIEGVRKLVHYYLENNNIEESELTLALVETAISPAVLGALIDLVVNSAKGKFNIKLSGLTKLWKNVCGCCKKQEKNE